MKGTLGRTFLEMLLRSVERSTDRELVLHCHRCDRAWVAFVTEKELIEAYRSPRRIPMSPSPPTVMARVKSTHAIRDAGMKHVCVPHGFHASIDDAATSAEWFEAVSCYFAELAIDATRVSELDPTRLAQLEMLLPEQSL